MPSRACSPEATACPCLPAGRQGKRQPGGLCILALAIALTLALGSLTGCTTSRTSTGNSADTTAELQLRTGDEVRVVTSLRERFRMNITEVTQDGLKGETVLWDASDIAPGQPVWIPYSELAFIQVERPSPVKTAGAVATVTLAGALVYLVSVAPVVLVLP